jgi:hypothetical protein
MLRAPVNIHVLHVGVSVVGVDPDQDAQPLPDLPDDLVVDCVRRMCESVRLLNNKCTDVVTCRIMVAWNLEKTAFPHRLPYQ